MQVQNLPGPGIDDAVAHQYEAVILLHFKTVFVYFFPLNLPYFIRVLHDFFIPDKHTVRVVIFHQVGVAVVENLQDAEGRVCHLPLLADGERPGNGLHAGFNGRPFVQHGGQDLGSQGGKDVGLDPAPHAVRQDQDIRIPGLYDLHLISAQLFSVFVQAFPSHVNTYAHIHQASSSLRMESRSLVSVTLVSAVVSPNSPAISWATIICLSMTFWAISMVSTLRL